MCFLCSLCAGAPDPPTGVQITPCVAFKTELSWTPSAANNASITHYIVEQADASDPNVFVFLKNVTDPSATKTDLKLTPWADLMFRMKAVNKLGTSRPSDRTTRSCVTEKAGRTHKRFLAWARAHSQLTLTRAHSGPYFWRHVRWSAFVDMAMQLGRFEIRFHPGCKLRLSCAQFSLRQMH